MAVEGSELSDELEPSLVVFYAIASAHAQAAAEALADAGRAPPRRAGGPAAEGAGIGSDDVLALAGDIVAEATSVTMLVQAAAA